MSFFDVLGAGESLFRAEEALDPEWVPKLLPFRDQQQFRIANCIKPLLQDRNGRNCVVFGAPGIGKTAATKWVLRDLEDNTDDVRILYVNCWQKNSTYKIFVELCNQLDYRFTQNKNSEELFKVIAAAANRKPAVFVFDEVDKVQDVDFLYSILNDIFKKSVVLITNYPSWLQNVEGRIKSRLTPEQLEFRPYSASEMKEILKQRLEFAFVPGCWDDAAFESIAKKAAESNDVRAGLYLLREAGLAAEEKSSRKISNEHAETAISKSGFSIKNPDELEDDAQTVLNLIKNEGEGKIGDLFKKYQDAGGKGTYKTFQRRVEKLSKGGFVNTKKVVGGRDGTTTIISEKNKSLDEF
ncbi:AAA family ATPase [Candidatus Woesearchaeota archaeon]|nr:AAA family ATPase [Candidatus Woesearchaeota archaeon]